MYEIPFVVRKALRMFCPAEGADDANDREIRCGYAVFSRLIHSTTGREITHVPGAGAAGGLGGAFSCFSEC